MHIKYILRFEFSKKLYFTKLFTVYSYMGFGRGKTKGGSRHKNWCMARVLSFLIRYFSNYYTLHRSDLAARAAPLDPRLKTSINRIMVRNEKDQKVTIMIFDRNTIIHEFKNKNFEKTDKNIWNGNFEFVMAFEWV